MKALVSFCIFGDDPEDFYYKGAIRNAQMYGELYPDWECRFYIGSSVPKAVIATLDGLPNTKIIASGEAENQTATFWRFLALRDSGFDAYIFRDVDGRPMPRELSAVEEWLASPQQYHVMRDHPRHGTEILAGLWGVKASGAEVLARRLPDRLHEDYYQVDQDFLRTKVWRHAKSSLMTHLGCRWDFKTTENVHPFPVDRSDADFFAGECRMGDGALRFPDHRAEVVLDAWRVEEMRVLDVPTPHETEVQRRRALRRLQHEL